MKHRRYAERIAILVLYKPLETYEVLINYHITYTLIVFDVNSEIGPPH